MPSFLFTVAIRFLRFVISSPVNAGEALQSSLPSGPFRFQLFSGDLRAVLNFSYRCLNSLCRLVETFAHTPRQILRGNCHAISRRLWPMRSDHGCAPFDPTYSMISSARPINDIGTVMPSA